MIHSECGMMHSEGGMLSAKGRMTPSEGIRYDIFRGRHYSFFI